MSEAEGSKPALATPPPPLSRPPYRRLVRKMDQRVLGGVAAGLGSYFGVDPLLFRLGFVVLAVAGGVGVFAYLLAWLIVPAEGRDEGAPLTERLLGRLRPAPTWLAVVVVGAGAAVVATQLGLWHPGLFWGAALIAVGVALFRPARPSSGSIPAPADEGTDREAPHLESPLPPLEATTPTPSAATPSPSPRRPRERSALGWIVLGVLLLALGLAAALDDAGVLSLAPVHYPALALTVIGLGLVAGTWWGRARWLVVPGLILIPVVLVASLIQVPLEGGFADRFDRPRSVAGLDSPYRLIAGEVIVDLTGFEADGPVRVVATVGAGRILVLVPPGASIRLHAEVGIGQVEALGRVDGGVEVDVDRTFGRPGGPLELVLDLRTDLGVVTLTHSEEAVPFPEEQGR